MDSMGCGFSPAAVPTFGRRRSITMPNPNIAVVSTGVLMADTLGIGAANSEGIG